MVDLGSAMIAAALAIGALQLITFAVSVPMRDVSIVDVTWGLCFVAAAWASFFVTSGPKEGALAASLVTLWGLRLAGHIALRHNGEDPRYVAMRRRADNFVLVSLYKVFLLQGVLAWIVVLPLVGVAASTDGDWGPLVGIGIALWAVGLFFETVGDWQLSRFKADPANKGKVMNRGLWRFTRHPNYFGDFCVWWGLYLVAVDAGAWWSIVSPLVMTILLTRVSGKDLLEKSMSKRPGYTEYVERTSGFFPLPPRS
jgi:steroid 5-alpha reductase family enzyme